MSEIENWYYLLKVMDRYFEERQRELKMEDKKLPERGQRGKKNKKKKKPSKK